MTCLDFTTVGDRQVLRQSCRLLQPVLQHRGRAQAPDITPVVLSKGWGPEHCCKILIRHRLPRALPYASRMESTLGFLNHPPPAANPQGKETSTCSTESHPGVPPFLFCWGLFFHFNEKKKFHRRQMHFMIFNNFVPWFNHSILRTSIKSVFKTNNST